MAAQIYKRFLGALLLLVSTQVNAADNRALIDEYLLPGYQAMAAANHQLAESAKAFCQKPDAAGLLQLQGRYNSSMDAWQFIQVVRFGPVEFQLRRHKLQLWPDKRNSVNKHLGRFLSEQNREKLAPESFRNSSAALQGYSALERLLFSGDELLNDGPDATFRCDLVQAIAANLDRLSAEIVQEWKAGDTPFREVLESAAQGNDFFESQEELESKLLNNMHTQLQLMVDEKLLRPLGASTKKANGRRAESWRSGRSLQHIRRNLDGLKVLFQVVFLPKLNESPLAQELPAAFDQAIKRVDEVGLPLAQAVTDEPERRQLEQLKQALSRLKGLFADDLPKALGLSLGFNSLDGD